MGRVVLVARLAARDLRWRKGEAVMLLIAMTAATMTLTLGLVLHGVTSAPYQRTRAATVGPDAVAAAFPQRGGPKDDLAGLASLGRVARAAGVTGRSGPFPVAFPVLRANGRTDAVLAEGRTAGPAAVDQPRLTEGSWVRSGTIVVERSFADALDVRTGDMVTLDGRPFRVGGIAVTAALPTSGIGFLEGSARWPNPGLVWLTEAAARSLASTAYPLGYVLNVRLAHPAGAGAFADGFDPDGFTDNSGSPYVIPWQQISRQDGLLVRSEQQILLVSSWLLAAIAMASLAVLVGVRIADQNRRVGLLKAVGGTPVLVARVLLAEYLAVASAAAVLGLVAGRFVAPLLTSPGAGLLGAAAAPPAGPGTAALVVAVALGVAVAATLVPALRAARGSALPALADSPRQLSPAQARRQGWLVGLSARLPVPLLIGTRLAARRPRRAVLSALTIGVTVTGVVAVLYAHASTAAAEFGTAAGRSDPALFDVGFASRSARASEVLLVVTALLAVLTVVNTLFVAWATVRDARHATAVTRTLGATARQVISGLSASQVGPALAGAVLGIPGGVGLFAVASHGGVARTPPVWWLIAAAFGTVLALTGFIAVSARASVRRPVADVLAQEG
jgi:putative ABC transport system permease protein